MSLINRVVAICSLCTLVMASGVPARAQETPQRLLGRILLQVEQHGEAWYVRPDDGLRVFMGRPADAFALMRSLGKGITDRDIRGIPLADANLDGEDSDGDGLPDSLEPTFGTDLGNADSDDDGHDDKTELLHGYDPLLPDEKTARNDLAKRQSGTILLQVEQSGEAWYVHPVDLKRYYLGRPDDAFRVMRSLGLGITDADLEAIMISSQRMANTPDVIEPEESDDTDENDIAKEDEDSEDSDFFPEPDPSPKPPRIKTTAEQWSGKIARDRDGVLWYVSPADLQRYRIGAKEQAFDSLYFFADYELSASQDLEVPPLANFNLAADDVDTDGDGLGDIFEDAFSSDKEDPDSNDDGISDLEEVIESLDSLDEDGGWKEFLDQSEGRILYSPIAAVYVPPGDGHSYFFRGPKGAAALVEKFAQSISPSDLAAIRRTERDDIVRCGVTEVDGGIESLSLDTDSSEPSEIKTNPGENVVSGKIAADCFDKKFQLCESAQHITTSTALFPLASAVIKSRIVGTENGACIVEIENLQTVVYGEPVSELFGKTMSCHLTSRNEPIVGRSFTMAATDGSTILDPSCTGSYADMIREALAQSQGTTISSSVVKQGLYRGPQKQSSMELVSPEELAQFWQSVFPESQPPVVDFTSKRVEVIFGERGSTALSFVRAAEFEEYGRSLFVRATQGKECTGVYDGQPYVVVTYPKHADDDGEDSWLYSPSIQAETEYGACPSDLFVISENERTYTNAAYGFSILLPDRTSYFTVKETAGVKDADTVLTITFSQHSIIDGEDIPQYAVDVIEKKRWPSIEEEGGFERDDEYVWVNKLGETDTHVIVWEDLWNSAPIDLGDYSSQELVFKKKD